MMMKIVTERTARVLGYMCAGPVTSRVRGSFPCVRSSERARVPSAGAGSSSLLHGVWRSSIPGCSPNHSLQRSRHNRQSIGATWLRPTLLTVVLTERPDLCWRAGRLRVGGPVFVRDPAQAPTTLVAGQRLLWAMHWRTGTQVWIGKFRQYDSPTIEATNHCGLRSAMIGRFPCRSHSWRGWKFAIDVDGFFKTLGTICFHPPR